VVSALVYGARASDVVLTMVGGRILYRDGALLTMDQAAVQQDAARSLVRLLRRVGATA
jgi:5-methylthioadenosine/S-adenosylhomocysteine deaminase